MNNNRLIQRTATAITLLALGAFAAASNNGNLAYDNEIESCVTEVIQRANLEEATRVRHLIVKVRRAGNGYVFSINTSIFTDSDDIAAREYASYCVANGNDKPVKFKISQIRG